jgi:hypothetical protein
MTDLFLYHVNKENYGKYNHCGLLASVFLANFANANVKWAFTNQVFLNRAMERRVEPLLLIHLSMSVLKNLFVSQHKSRFFQLEHKWC